MSAPRRIAERHAARGAVEVALNAAPLLAALALGYRQRWVAEDAFITLRVVDNLLAGHGPVFNVGERVEVYTHPLWLLIITALGALGLPPAQAAAYTGLGLAVAGLTLAQMSAARLSRYVLGEAEPRRRITLPIGTLAFVSIPVVWDFLTSGLETGLSFAWLGLSFGLLVRRALDAPPPGQERRLPLLEAVIFGLGPLVRPDLGIFALGFLAGLLICDVAGRDRRSALTGTLWLLLGFGSVPGLYQIFRMGYFAALVPNPALAKEAGRANWARGWAYFTDFTGAYHLWIPLGIALAAWLALLAGARRRDFKAATAVAVPPIAAMLHALYIIRVGGDFMHARLLLPALFGLLLPVAAVSVAIPDRQRLRTLLPWCAIAVVGVWAVSCALLFRWPYGAADIQNGIPQGIIDERRFFVEQTGRRHLLSVDDYRGISFEWVEHGLRMRALAATHPRTVLTDLGNHPLGDWVDGRIALVVYARSIGVQSHAAGDAVRLVDLHGLGDPLASRMKINEDERTGHAKQLPLVWIHARYADLSRIGPVPADLQAAAGVLRCGDVAALIDAVEEPLTLRRFLRNIASSWSLTRLRIDPDPFVARAQLCGAAH